MIAPTATVTFDTNTLDRAVRPERFPKDDRRAEYEKIHRALTSGALKGYFSDTLVTLEAIERKDRSKVLGSTRLARSAESTGPNSITLSFAVQQDRAPLHAEFERRISAARNLGLRALRGPPRIGWISIRDDDGTFYTEAVTDDASVTRMEKTIAVATAIQARGLGQAQIAELALSFSERAGKAGEPWFEGLRRARDAREEEQIKRAVAEWADADSVAAHIGHGIDFFCSEDKGGSTGGAPSILDRANREWLAATWAVRFVTLSELSALL